jgi:hypothetical protein
MYFLDPYNHHPIPAWSRKTIYLHLTEMAQVPEQKNSTSWADENKLAIYQS